MEVSSCGATYTEVSLAVPPFINHNGIYSYHGAILRVPHPEDSSPGSYFGQNLEISLYMWLLPQKRVLAPRTLFHSRRFLMFDCLILAFYSADSIENWGVFLSYNRESKSNFFCNLFSNVARWLLWFLNSVPFHVRNCTRNKIVDS